MDKGKEPAINRLFLKDGKYRIFGRKVKRGLSFTVAEGQIPSIQVKQCCFLNENGKRCRIKSALKLQLHVDNELYQYPAWVEVNLCPEHYIHFGGTFGPKFRKEEPK